MTEVDYVIAKYTYEAQEDSELSVKKHDRLILVDDSRNWWKVLNDKRQSGYVPSNYVRREKLLDTLKRKISPMIRRDASHGSLQIGSGSAAPAAFAKDKPRPPLPAFSNTGDFGLEGGPVGMSRNITTVKDEWNEPTSERVNTTAIVKYCYDASRDDELNLKKGQQVLVMEKSSDGWWRGESEGRHGWFPSNYVIEQAGRNMGFYNSPSGQNPSQVLKIATPSFAESPNPVLIPPRGGIHVHQNGHSSSQMASPGGSRSTPLTASPKPLQPTVTAPRQADVLERVIALFNFEAQDEIELNFVKGEWLDVIERPLDDPEWLRVRNLAGSTGLVPKNYVKTMLDANDNASVTPKKVLDAAASSGGKPQLSPGLLGESPMKSTPTFIRARLSGPYSHCQWYYGILTRDEADSLLNNFGTDGDFLLRDSESNPGDFSISLKAPGRNKHFWVKVEGAGFGIGTRHFDSLEDIIAHYKVSPIYTNGQGEKLFLIRPLPS